MRSWFPDVQQAHVHVHYVQVHHVHVFHVHEKDGTEEWERLLGFNRGGEKDGSEECHAWSHTC